MINNSSRIMPLGRLFLMHDLERALVISLTKSPKLENILTENGFLIVDGNPDFIISYGGDGTILFSERMHPQVPKLIIKRENACRKFDYSIDQLPDILMKIRKGKYEMRHEIKLEAAYKQRKLVGLNEIQIHAKLPISAVRFALTVDGRIYENLIGDGVVIATPFGSTGYYKSTGGKPFTRGIGISFNNLHNKRIPSLVASENSVLKMRIDRGPALLLADNDQNIIELEKEDRCSIKKSETVAKFIYVSQ
ncbi:NAD(+)/NADH kinase [Candidatus Bathyarchaeota archaeon]|nr:NAD(+)/NADH kinase [Candidatus Bathyarchaeota archaeon]